MSVQLKTPAANLIYTFDWSADVADDAALSQVSYTLPADGDLNIINQALDIPNSLSSITLSGGLHGKVYVVSALAIIGSEQVPAQVTIRVQAT